MKDVAIFFGCIAALSMPWLVGKLILYPLVFLGIFGLILYFLVQKFLGIEE